VGRSFPARKSFYRPHLLGLLNLARNRGGTGLEKSYLLHPDSDLDVPHMNFDLLDETYSMVKSK
jgi:hypothetical protein